MFQKEHLKNFVRESYVHGDINKKLEQYSIKVNDVIDCALGTNPYGFSPEIKKVISNLNFEDISSYPSPDNSKLKNAIVDYWGSQAITDKDSIFIGTGSIDMLEMINKAYVDTRCKVLGYCPQFTEYASEVRVFGGTYDYVPLNKENRFKFSMDDLLLGIKSFKPDILYLDNPNNPTGQIIDIKDIDRIVNYAKGFGIIVLVDEAYGDFMLKENSAVNLVGKYDNLIVTRTFSKGMGLAGLRVGYVVAGKKIKENLAKVELPFRITNFTEALAVKALEDQGYINDCRIKIHESKEKLINACVGKYIISETSLDTPILVLGALDNETDLYEFMLSKGILTEAGADFINMGKKYIRLRIPKNVQQLINRII